MLHDLCDELRKGRYRDDRLGRPHRRVPRSPTRHRWHFPDRRHNGIDRFLQLLGRSRLANPRHLKNDKVLKEPRVGYLERWTPTFCDRLGGGGLVVLFAQREAIAAETIAEESQKFSDQISQLLDGITDVKLPD